MQWEYMMWVNENFSDPIGHLNTLGEERWEVVWMDVFHARARILLKRQKLGPPP